MEEPREEEPEAVEVEVLEALPVPAGREGMKSVELRRVAPLATPLIQTAAAAASGFLAGALTLALLRRADARRLIREPRPPAPVQTYYVRVRLIHGDRDPGRG